MSKKKNKNSLPQIQLGLATIPDKDKAIAKIAEVEPEYEDYLNNLPSEKKRRIINSINRVQTGLHAVAPIMCMGPVKCPFISKCPIPESNGTEDVVYGPDSNYPIGRECILEKFYMQQKIIEYVEHLNVSPDNPVEMSIVNELALIDLYKNRSLMIMSVGDRSGQGRDFMRTDILGFNENGDVAESSKLHPAVEMLDKLEKRREKWYDKLMETRKAKADWMAKIGNTNSESKILGEIQKLREALTSLESNTPLELVEEDEDILLSD